MSEKHRNKFEGVPTGQMRGNLYIKQNNNYNGLKHTKSTYF